MRTVTKQASVRQTWLLSTPVPFQPRCKVPGPGMIGGGVNNRPTKLPLLPAGQERNNKDYNNEVNNIRVMICLFRKDTCTNYYRRYEQLIGQTTIVNNVRVMKCLFRKDTCTNEYRRSEQLI